MDQFWDWLKPLSVTTNVIGLQTDDANHVGQKKQRPRGRVVGLQTDAVVVTEARLKVPKVWKVDLTGIDTKD